MDREKLIEGLEMAKDAIDLWIPMFEQRSAPAFIEEAIAVLKTQPQIVRCKDCKHRGNSEKCVLSAISEEKDFPLFMLDNSGEWFCADGKGR